jgi:hypothetical protein
MDKEELLKLIEDDDLGLLKTKPQVSGNTADERLIAKFEEINEFVRKHGRPPLGNGKDIHEISLYHRLKGINEDPAKSASLAEFDTFSILKPVKPIETVSDIFEDDDLGLLDDGPESIFTLKNVPKFVDMPDEIARRSPCPEFEQFEPLFKECHAKLSIGERTLVKFEKEQEIFQGQFFVLNGVMVYIAEEGEREEQKGKINARLRCIFENGTESNMLLRSLAAELYKKGNGQRVIFSTEETLANLNPVTVDDQETGHIYILRSLSQKPEIKGISNLFKIGFSKQSIESRLKNAEQDPTFLMAPVSLVTSYQCFNLNPQKMELLLHTFFAESCLNLDVYDVQGKRHIPREWFVAPLDVIEQAVRLLLNEEIVHYKYDSAKQEIILR